MVKVLVGQGGGATDFEGFYAEFEGEEISHYKNETQDKNIVYTLYKCTAYNFDAYRVHIADESNHQKPVYELHPFEQRPRRLDWSEPFKNRDLAQKFPLFLKDLEDFFDTRPIDPA